MLGARNAHVKSVSPVDEDHFHLRSQLDDTVLNGDLNPIDESPLSQLHILLCMNVSELVTGDEDFFPGELHMRTLLGIGLAIVSLLCGLELLSHASAREKERATRDEQKLSGNWVCVSAERAGKSMPANIVKKLRLVLTRSKYATYRGDELLFEGKSIALFEALQFTRALYPLP
jgi:hypothetical protein